MPASGTTHREAIGHPRLYLLCVSHSVRWIIWAWSWMWSSSHNSITNDTSSKKRHAVIPPTHRQTWRMQRSPHPVCLCVCVVQLREAERSHACDLETLKAKAESLQDQAVSYTAQTHIHTVNAWASYRLCVQASLRQLISQGDHNRHQQEKSLKQAQVCWQAHTGGTGMCVMHQQASMGGWIDNQARVEGLRKDVDFLKEVSKPTHLAALTPPRPYCPTPCLSVHLSDQPHHASQPVTAQTFNRRRRPIRRQGRRPTGHQHPQHPQCHYQRHPVSAPHRPQWARGEAGRRTRQLYRKTQRQGEHVCAVCIQPTDAMGCLCVYVCLVRPVVVAVSRAGAARVQEGRCPLVPVIILIGSSSSSSEGR